jgi:hypothetical protein
MADAIAELPLTQAAGEPPAVLAAGSGPGEHGLAVFKVRFRGGVHIESPSPRSPTLSGSNYRTFSWNAGEHREFFAKPSPEARLLSALPASTALLTRDRARVQFSSRLSPVTLLSQPQKIQPSGRS